jgi:DNA polymerase III subunit delta'
MQFSAVIGQAALKEQLIREINSEKISHAKLFAGKNGHGSLAIALAYCKYLLCENKQETDSCGSCHSCKQMSDFVHPDVHFVFPLVLANNQLSSAYFSEWRGQLITNPYFDLLHWTKTIDTKERKPVIGTEESIDIQKKLSLKAYQGNYKVMIIWCADEMNTTCANKLLKILEEPTPYTLFILTTENQQKLLPTIQSRTQTTIIPRISLLDLTHQLVDIHGLEERTAKTIAAFSDGNYIRALELVNDDASNITYRDQFMNLMRCTYKKDVIAMLDWAEELSATSKERQKLFILYSLHMLRQSLANNYIGMASLPVSDEEASFINKFSPYISGNNISDFLKTFDEAYYHIERNAFAKLLFTQICFQTMRYIHQA